MYCLKATALLENQAVAHAHLVAQEPVGANASLAAARLAETALPAAPERTESRAIGSGPPIDDDTLTQRALRLFSE